MTIYAHHRAGDPTAFLDGTSTPVLLEQLLALCAVVGTTITYKTVIDLAADPTSTGYQPSPSLHEQTRLRDQRCVFPYCNRRRTDADHITEYDPGGPPGQTRSHNLGRCCRTHHRAKTHSRWDYQMLSPGI